MKIFFLLIWTLSLFSQEVPYNLNKKLKLSIPIPEKVLICGVCQNVEKPLPHTIKIMGQIGALFSDYKIIVYENNSTDKTVNILKRWQKKDSHVKIISENLSKSELSSQIVNRNKDGSFYRAEQIARARNIVLDQVMSDQYADFSYVIWMDMDFKIAPHLEGMVEVFQSQRDWDAIFAYGIDPPGTYWDWYAFRDTTYPLGSELLGNQWWYMTKKFHLSYSDDWYPVYSAFGGCAIYKKSSIIGCRYSAVVTEDLEKLSLQLIEKGQEENHHQIAKYLSSNCNLVSTIAIDRPIPHLPRITNPDIGIHCMGKEELIWRMSSFVYQYPSVCEHVTFHASMIARGHEKLFIHPRLIFTYGE